MRRLPAPPPFVAEPLYTTAEVAALFHVAPESVTRWARSGKIPAAAIVRGPFAGSHRRYKAAVIDALRQNGSTTP